MHDLRHDPTTGNVLNGMPRHDPEESDDRWLRPAIAAIAARQFERVNMPDLRHDPEESPRPVTVHCAPIADYDTRPAVPERDCAVWTAKVDERLAALEAAIALHADRIQVLMLQQDDGK